MVPNNMGYVRGLERGKGAQGSLRLKFCQYTVLLTYMTT